MNRFRLPATVLLVVLGLLLTGGHSVVGAEEAKHNLRLEDATTPAGARGRLAIPANWNGRLLIIAHGFIPAGRPLYAGFDAAADPMYRPLLDEGWCVAATSYRRNGLVLRDGAADVEELRRLVAARLGRPPDAVFVEGSSMGGFIVALLAENPPHPSYRGALALGAALDISRELDPKEEVPTLAARPRFPVLFLSNRDEAAGPADYTHRANPAANAAVWTVVRDGHVNLNRQEISTAFAALRRWAEDGGKIEPTRDGTLPAPEPPPTVVFAADGLSATGRVLAVDPAYGNFTMDFRPADLARLGLKRGDTAVLRVGNAENVAAAAENRVLLGTTFDDVKQGEWVCFPTADGHTLVCRNFADAAGSTGATVGSAVTFLRRR